jgi:hypothetical protein
MTVNDSPPLGHFNPPEAEIAELRAQVTTLAAEADRVADTLSRAFKMAAFVTALWDEAFAAGQASASPEVPAPSPRDRHGLRLVAGTRGGTI